MTKPAKKRATDKDQGDKKIINEPEDITKKGVTKESTVGQVKLALQQHYINKSIWNS